MVHYVHKYKLKNTVLMEATKSGRQIDIHLSIEKMVSAGYDFMINPALILPLHAISGCDTVAAYFGIAKKKTLNELSYGGQEVVNYWRFNRRQRRCTVYSAVSDFLSRCYGCVPQEDMAVVRSKVWFSGLQHQHTLLQNYKLYLQQRQHCCLIS